MDTIQQRENFQVILNSYTGGLGKVESLRTFLPVEIFMTPTLCRVDTEEILVPHFVRLALVRGPILRCSTFLLY